MSEQPRPAPDEDEKAKAGRVANLRDLPVVLVALVGMGLFVLMLIFGAATVMDLSFQAFDGKRFRNELLLVFGLGLAALTCFAVVRRLKR